MDRNFPTDTQIREVMKFIRAGGTDGARSQELLTSLKIADSALNSALDLLKHLELIEQDANGLLLAKPGAEQRKIDTDYLNQRRKRDTARLDRILQYGQKRTCRRSQILTYFGQQLTQPCSGCDVCHPRSISITSLVMDSFKLQ
jgi:ATP-dependent DNA helicase RecQ